jgi:hypothetical protein
VRKKDGGDGDDSDCDRGDYKNKRIISDSNDNNYVNSSKENAGY